MLTFIVLIIAVAAVAHAYYSLQSARALINQAHALNLMAEQAVQALKAVPGAPPAAPQRRVIAINRYKVSDNEWAVMADADDGTVWTYEDEYGWLLARQKRAIPQLPVEPTLRVKPDDSDTSRD